MKKVLFALSIAALALASCTEFEAETPVTYETADVPVISAEVTSDTSIKIKVEPGANTGYYAYAFVAGEVDPAEVNPATLLAGKFAALKTEVANSAKADSLVAEIKKLSPNTKYTLVAVASDQKTQALSEVVAKTLKTTDETVPEVVLKNYDYEVVEDTTIVFSVPFDDAIALTDTAFFYVETYGANYDYGSSSYYILRPLAQIPIPAENVALEKDGHTLTIEVPADGYAPGAFVGLFIEAGSVVNELGAVNEAFEDNMVITRGSYAGLQDGLIAQYAPKNFDFECSLAADSLLKFADAATVSIDLIPQCEGAVNGLAAYGDGAVKVTAVHSATGRKVEYTLSDWDIDNTTGNVYLCLDENPDFGCWVSYSVAEGIVEDLYGNKNNALEIEDQLFRSYGYSLDDIVGTYAYEFYSNSAGDYENGELVIEAAPKIEVLGDNDEYECNVKFTKFAGATLTNPLYAVFDLDAGTLTIPDWQQVLVAPIAETDPQDYYIYIYSTYNNPATGISVPAAGVLDGFDDTAFGFAIYQYSTQKRLGFNWYLSFYAERTGPVPTSAPKAAKAIKPGKIEKAPKDRI